MKLATIQYLGREQAALLTSSGVLPLATLNEHTGSQWETNVQALLSTNQLGALQAGYAENVDEQEWDSLPLLPFEQVEFSAFARQPGKIIGIGMNYMEKAIELSGRPPEEEPVIFLKPNSSIIGPGEEIVRPEGAGAISAEAELAIVIGRECHRVTEAEALHFAAGYLTSLDMTAKDIHARNPRFMQRAKIFDTFVSLGAVLVTPDECGELPQLVVETVHNGAVIHRNQVAQMIFSPAQLIAFLSQVMTLQPGDIILTGTPGSVIIEAGDQVECRITGLPALCNPVCNQS
ncbi:fumarylacetoacetate hydrolase [Saccharibacillus sp. O16]|nr:fumarylacetoacetate hydrolase [Saccharibacillus sp. O16]